MSASAVSASSLKSATAKVRRLRRSLTRDFDREMAAIVDDETRPRRERLEMVMRLCDNHRLSTTFQQLLAAAVERDALASELFDAIAASLGVPATDLRFWPASRWEELSRAAADRLEQLAP